LSRRFGLWPAFGLGLGLIAMVVAIGARSQLADAQSDMASNRQPLPQVEVVQEPLSEPVEAPAVVSNETVSPLKTQGEVTVSAEVVPTTRLGYDLDHTMPTPTSTENRDSKLPTY